MNSNIIGVNTYNVCSGDKTTIALLIDSLLYNIQNDVEVEYTGSTPGDQFGIFGDNSHIKKELNWEPKIKLKAGLTLMYRWTIENI